MYCIYPVFIALSKSNLIQASIRRPFGKLIVVVAFKYEIEENLIPCSGILIGSPSAVDAVVDPP